MKYTGQKALQILAQAGKLEPPLKDFAQQQHINLRANITIIKEQTMKKIVVLLWLAILTACAGCQSTSGSARPLIGITSVYKVDKENNSASTLVGFAYVKAVAENAGAPVVLPTVTNEEILQRYVRELDGLVLVGGDDIPPSAYGRQPHETVKVMPEQRYASERQLISMWLSSGKPILGICLGMQFTNVVSGGTLIQDIPSQVGTEVAHRRNYHRVRIEPGSSLAELLGAEEALVYSNHHQAVDKPGKKLKVIAHAEDGVIEAMEHVECRFGLFVQWHPESMKDTAHRDAIYGALIRAAAHTNSNKRKGGQY